MRLIVAVFLSFSLGLQSGIYFGPLVFGALRRQWSVDPGQLVPLVQAQDAGLPAKTSVPYREQTVAGPGERDEDSSGQEKIFEDMDRLNLEMARLQMEKKLAQIELEKLQLYAQQEVLRSQVQPDMTMVSRSTVRLDAPTSAASRSPLKIISITAFGDQQSVSLDAGFGPQEFARGDYIKADSSDGRRVEDIDPANNCVTISEEGKSNRYCLQ